MFLARALLAGAGVAAQPEIEGRLAQAAAMNERMGAIMQLPHIDEVRAMLARARGDEEAARAGLDAARRSFAELGADGHAARIATLLAEPAA